MNDEWKYGLLMVVAIAVIATLAWLVPSYFEAQAYNRATGSDVSMWDAMWIELRVQAGPR